MTFERKMTATEAEALIEEREAALAAAVADGRLLQKSVPEWRAIWNKNPQATAATLAGLAAGLPPSAAVPDPDPDPGPSLSAQETADLYATFGARHRPQPSREPDAGGPGYPSRAAAPVPEQAAEVGLSEAEVIAHGEAIVAQWDFPAVTGS